MRFAIIATVAALVAAPAAAQTQTGRFVSGNWRGQAYFSDQGRFTSCSMYARYRSGISLYFGLTRNARFRVGFWKPEWELDEGSRHRVALFVDRQPVFQGTAKVVSLRGASMVLVDLPLARPLFNRLRGGYVLHVDAPRGRMGFSLAGSNAALVQLIRCVASRIDIKKKRPGVAGYPFAGPDRRPPGLGNDPPASAESDRVRAVTLIANTLSRALISGYEIVPLNEVPKRWRRFHALWRSGKTLGLVRLYRDSSRKTGRTIYSAAAAADFDHCKGAYQSGVKRGDADGKTITFFSRCVGEPDWSLYYIVIGPDRTGVTYLVGLFSPDKNEPIELGERIRKALTDRVLKRQGAKKKEHEVFEQ